MGAYRQIYFDSLDTSTISTRLKTAGTDISLILFCTYNGQWNDHQVMLHPPITIESDTTERNATYVATTTTSTS